MISLTRLHGEPIVVNADHLLFLEQVPETKLILTNGHNVMVRETPEEVIRRVLDYRRSILMPSAREHQEVA